MKVKALLGSGGRILGLTLPFLAAGLALNILFPSFFRVGGPPAFLKAVSIIFLVPGVTIWLWSAALILIKVPRGELITKGPYALVKHPIYTAVSLAVLPWAGFLFDTWLGAAIGIILYGAARRYSPEEDRALAKDFGEAWVEYAKGVKIPWL